MSACSITTFAYLYLQVRCETPPRSLRTAASSTRDLPSHDRVNFFFRPALASEGDGAPVAFPRDTCLREASLRLRSLYNVGPNTCAALVLGEETFTEVRSVCPVNYFIKPHFHPIFSCDRVESSARPRTRHFFWRAREASIRLCGCRCGALTSYLDIWMSNSEGCSLNKKTTSTSKSLFSLDDAWVSTPSTNG
jgi:hypothetical protein